MAEILLSATPYIQKYIFSLGIFIFSVGIIEIIFPLKMFTFWKKWVSNRYFFLYGIILIIAGFPLTVYKGSLSTIIFTIGTFIAFTGPFILFFPEKLNNTLNKMTNELEVPKLKKMILFDASVRIITGIFLSVSYFL